MTETARNWSLDNQRYLSAALRTLGLRLADIPPATAEQEDAVAIATDMRYPPALETLRECFSLSEFERDIVLLCAGVELDAKFAEGCPSLPTFGLALSRLEKPHWSALTPASPLRRWRLVELGAGVSPTSSPLRIDERILHYLTGISYLDERLQPLVTLVPAPREVTVSHRMAVDRIKAAFRDKREWPLVQLGGNDQTAKEAVAALACAELDLQLHALRGADVPTGARDRDNLARLWEREALLHRGALLVSVESADARAVLPFVEQVHGLIVVTSDEPLALGARPVLRLDVDRPPPSEQHAAWLRHLGPLGERIDGDLRHVVSQFDFGLHTIRAASAQLDAVPDTDKPGQALWEICRSQSRPRLDDLAQRIEPAATWEDLVLPEEQLATLRDIAAHVRQRFQVYQMWGFATKGSRGLGISAVFSGPSGTGKTMAAEVLAAELHLDLYRIDLSSVVSKYIGETEKHLRRLFDAAEEGGAVLLFDEADALFGKRSEVKDSHDRYANIEVSYLLQRMDAYRGLAILTTNMKNALDAAFLRRIRFVVQFPFPDAQQRRDIWRRIFPNQTPTEGLDFDQLKRLSVTGGSIRAIALDAAFMAADSGAPVGMRHMLQAARREYLKLEKPMADSETSGWLG
jgi:hypothetical protein